MNCSMMDKIMWFISNDFFIYPILLVGLIVIWQKISWKLAIITLISILICIGISDGVSNFTKHQVKRYRPTHNLVLKDKIHIVNNYRGGTYGFFSSHAANTTSSVFLLIVVLLPVIQSKKLVWIWMIIPLIISYSRVYLGVHYVSDVLTGMIFGLIAALISLKFLSFLKGRFNV